MTTILVTGFGPFPGAPLNPTATLAKQLARRPLAATRIIAHVFPTSYAAVNRDLPKLIARHRPDALLMFGLATEARTLRIETCARNALSPVADASGFVPGLRQIAPGGAGALSLPTPSRLLFAVARATHIPVVVSDDAGSYLCNYLCWRTVLAARRTSGPRLAAFIHVPPALNAHQLSCAGQAILKIIVAILR